MTNQKRIISPINDYSCVYNKNSEFLYTPVEKVEAFAVRRENFNSLMSDLIGKKMKYFVHEKFQRKLKAYITKNYKDLIQEPLYEHRNETAGKYENRIDYVDMSAYGVGKVKEDTRKSQSSAESEISDID